MPEEQVLLRKMRAEKLAKEKGKTLVREHVEKETQLREKKREADVVKLKAIKLRREDLELEEKALHASLEETETLGVTGSRREKRVYDEEDESTDFDSHQRELGIL